MRGVTVALKIIRYVAIAGDPLPSLPGERERRPLDGKLELLGWALTASVLVASSSYWMGMQSLREGPGSSLRASTAPKSPVLLQQPRTAQAAGPEVSQEGPSKSQPIVVARIPVILPPTSEQKRASLATEQIKGAMSATTAETSAGGKTEESGERTAASTRMWPVQTVEGASGRLVRIGHFATASEAEKGWGTVLRQYPGMQRLRSLAVPIKSLRDGHLYYRLQVGTTSQAHSDVVCQRMRDMDQSCTVIGSDEGSGETAT